MAKTRKPPPPPPPPPPPAPAETPSPQRKRKKKGRPSLLDLQRRSLRLQAQSPEAAASSPPRREPNPSDEDEDAGGGSGRRRQKRLRSVLSGAGEEEEEAVEEERKDAAKATGKGAAASDGGPTGTPLPDKKLLLFILDRLQKKDTYGVYSEPVDPEELPDYHELIEHPMDFSTIREKLLNDSYTILEQFESDVFLLTSNAMSYNSDDTVYHRQARSIEALAKKDFENLRQASDSEEEEPKPAPRRGRPPKNAKKPIEKVEGDVSPDLSNVKANRSADNTETRKRWTSDRARNTSISTRDSSILHQHTFGSFSGKRTEKTAAYSGPSKYGKKITYLDDDRRSTYDQQDSHYSPFFSALDCERKQLIPIGVQQQLTYARSLARFAATLGPIGWDIAAKGIRRALPPGTKFGPGWVVDGEPPQNSQWSRVPESTDPSAEPSIPSCGITPKSDDLRRSSEQSPTVDSTVEEHLAKNMPVASTSSGVKRSSTFASNVPTYENGVDSAGNTRPTPPMQQQQQSHSQEIPSNINGITAAAAAVPNTVGQYAGQGLFGPGMQMTHAQVLGMFSGVNGRANGFLHGHLLAAESVKAAQNGVVGKASAIPSQDAGHHDNPKGSFPQNENNTAAAPSLNAGSPPMGKAANPKHPDLVLQL
uniref:Uncharacterized protein n=1 Tax=Avena sativa TaxID=4498 RepID=A0ACD5WRF5_AVESA